MELTLWRLETGRIYHVKRILNMQKHAAIALALAAGLAVASAPAMAAGLLPGGSVGLAGTVAPTGPVLVDTGVLAFGNASTGGTVREIAYANPGNTVLAGGVTFAFQFTVTH